MSEVRMFGGEPKPPLDENLLEHHGVKGMRWGVRRRLENRGLVKTSAQKNREAKTGIKYRTKTYKATVRAKEGAIKKHYSSSEIKAARRIQAGRREAIKALDKKYGKEPLTLRSLSKGRKLIMTKQHEKAYDALLNSRERVVAKHRTTGEKAAAILLAGPVGYYLTSDLTVYSRVSNQRA